MRCDLSSAGPLQNVHHSASRRQGHYKMCTIQLVYDTLVIFTTDYVTRAQYFAYLPVGKSQCHVLADNEMGSRDMRVSYDVLARSDAFSHPKSGTRHEGMN